MAKGSVRYRVNNGIRAREVRVIDNEGKQLGILQTRKAIDIARERGLDLVEVASNALPPVCKIMDYGKFLYDREKQTKKSRKHQKIVTVKEVYFRPNIEEHDYQFKKNNLIKFLKNGDRAKAAIRYRGRESSHAEIGERILIRLKEDLKEYAVVDKGPIMEGRILYMIISPKSAK